MPQSFDDWFKEFNSWGLSHEDLLRCAFTPGDDSGDVVFKSARGVEMSRYQCSKWIAFYGAAKAGWDACKCALK